MGEPIKSGLVCNFDLDTGTFILDLETLKLVGLLKEKFSWGSLLAAQKGVTFRVEDDTLATDFGSGAVVAVMALTGSDWHVIDLHGAVPRVLQSSLY